MKQEMTFEPPNLLIMRLKGKWTKEELLEMNDTALNLVGEKREIIYLADLAELTEVPPETREALIKYRLPFTYLKMALFGASTKLKVLGGLILKMLPTVKKSKFFDTEQEARAWLSED